jgi:anti-repressor protein
MQDLIQINNGVVGQETIQTVNARELHGFLGNQKQYADWIKDRIAKYGFIDGIDYTTFSLKSEKPQAGRPAKEYHISIDMAKELAMVERNEQGRKARQYFIECEKRLKAVEPAALPATFSEALRLLADTVEKNAQQQLQITQQSIVIETQKPAVEFVEQYVETKDLKNFRTVAKILGAKELDFRAFLDSNKIMYKKGKIWLPHSVPHKHGYFEVKTGVTSQGNTYEQAFFTTKGVEWIARRWANRVPKLTR